MRTNKLLDLDELAEYVADKALEIIAEKQKPVVTNAMKFNEVFGFMPAGCQTFYFSDPNGSYSKTINWQEPYKEPEHED